MSGVFVPPLVWEAICDCAASHPPTCACVACRTVTGDASAAERAIRIALGVEPPLSHPQEPS